MLARFVRELGIGIGSVSVFEDGPTDGIGVHLWRSIVSVSD